MSDVTLRASELAVFNELRVGPPCGRLSSGQDRFSNSCDADKEKFLLVRSALVKAGFGGGGGACQSKQVRRRVARVHAIL